MLLRKADPLQKGPQRHRAALIGAGWAFSAGREPHRSFRMGALTRGLSRHLPPEQLQQTPTPGPDWQGYARDVGVRNHLEASERRPLCYR